MIFKTGALVLLTILFMSNGNAQTTDSTESFSGINLTNSEESLFIPIKEKVTLKTNTSKFRGVLDTVFNDQLFINGIAISKGEIEVVKYFPTVKRKKRNAFLLSAPISFAGAIGFGFWYLGSGGEWTNKAATALLIYTPVGLITGIVLSKKQKFKLNGEWTLTILE